MAGILQRVDWYKPDVEALEAVRKAQGPLTNPVVFYGSSTIRLWHDLPGDLECPNAINLGFGGSTLEACVFFFERLVLPEKPGSLVVYAGDNDIGDGKSPEQVFGFFQQLAGKVRKNLGNLSFGYISIKPSPARAALIDRIRSTNALIQTEIAKQEGGYFINLFDDMLTPQGGPNASLFESDGLHLNEAGYKLWTKLLIPYRNRIFTPQSYASQSNPVTSAEA